MGKVVIVVICFYKKWGRSWVYKEIEWFFFGGVVFVFDLDGWFFLVDVNVNNMDSLVDIGKNIVLELLDLLICNFVVGFYLVIILEYILVDI